jgi:hypothetical protein
MWWELSQNPRVVLAYYSQPPQLRNVEVHSVLLHREGPVLELLTEMPRFPDKPSPRWPADANTAQARLRFFDLREVSGWGTTNTGDLLVEREGGAIRFRFDCPTARLAGLAGFFDITGMTGYIKGTPNA